MAKIYPECSVGRYNTPKETMMPYLDLAIIDRRGDSYDLQNNEGSENVTVELAVYDKGSLSDSTCEIISLKAKEVMYEYGFQCRYGPTKTANANTDISRWLGRYERVLANKDKF